jgi:hypothetical protein
VAAISIVCSPFGFYNRNTEETVTHNNKRASNKEHLTIRFSPLTNHSKEERKKYNIG